MYLRRGLETQKRRQWRQMKFRMNRCSRDCLKPFRYLPNGRLMSMRLPDALFTEAGVHIVLARVDAQSATLESRTNRIFPNFGSTMGSWAN